MVDYFNNPHMEWSTVEGSSQGDRVIVDCKMDSMLLFLRGGMENNTDLLIF
jgi:hypothetical protein